MVFYAAFNSISVISWRQFTLFMSFLGFTSTRLGAKKKKKMHFELSLLIIWIALWIVNTYFEFQVIIFSNKRDITKCQSFYTPPMTTIPRVFSENSQTSCLTHSHTMTPFDASRKQAF